MGKKGVTKKGGGDGTPQNGDEDYNAASLTPRGVSYRTWMKRVEDTVIAMRQVQQLLQLHTNDVDALKRELEDLTLTAAALWAVNMDDLPIQYKDRHRAPTQRMTTPGGNASRSTEVSPLKRQQTSSGSISSRNGADSASHGGEAAAPGTPMESVEQAILQLTTAQRTKVSVALQAMFYAQPAPPTVVVVTEKGSDTAACGDVTPRGSVNPGATKQGKISLTAATGGAGQSILTSTTGAPGNERDTLTAGSRKNAIPTALLYAMRELQLKRVHLEAQLMEAASDTAKQLQRFQLLDEELMVAQYACDAARRDPQQEFQRQLSQQQLVSPQHPESPEQQQNPQTHAEGVPASS